MPNEKPSYSFIDVNTSDIAYCTNCEKVGYRIKLGERVYPEGEQIPEDHDQWCQCHRCGKIYAIHERKQAGQFSYFKDTVKDPFESGSQFESTKKRKHKNRLNDYKEREEDI